MQNWINNIKRHFQGRSVFNKADLEKVLRSVSPHLTESSLNWRIFELKQKGVIVNTARGTYTLTQKEEFQPLLTDEIKEIFNYVTQNYPFAQICVSDTTWLNDLMIHQVFKTAIILEVEKEAALSVFYALTTIRKDVFFEPDDTVIERYIQSVDKPLIIKQLISQSPLFVQEGISIPKIEKLLIDIIAEKDLYASQQTEADHIYQEAKGRYNINKSTLYRYAKRRNRYEQVLALMNENLKKHD